MRILFSVRNPSYVRHYESVLRALAARGHKIDLTTEERAGKASWPPAVVALTEVCPAIRLSLTPTLADDPWWELATRLRQARFYLRFLEPAYHGHPGYWSAPGTRRHNSPYVLPSRSVSAGSDVGFLLA